MSFPLEGGNHSERMIERTSPVAPRLFRFAQRALNLAGMVGSRERLVVASYAGQAGSSGRNRVRPHLCSWDAHVRRHLPAVPCLTTNRRETGARASSRRISTPAPWVLRASASCRRAISAIASADDKPAGERLRRQPCPPMAADRGAHRRHASCLREVGVRCCDRASAKVPSLKTL